MSTTSEVKVKLQYTDGDSRTYRIGNVDTEETTIAQIKAQIAAFNSALQNTSSSVYLTFVSDDGAHAAKISEAQLITTTEEEIYSG